MSGAADPEARRLAEPRPWKRWGPYLADRQWSTVREDYSADGDSWGALPHDHARSRAYRWGEDGLLGFCDDRGFVCFALALWNGRDPILKERLFGLTGPEGNRGEDVKEEYFYIDSTPTHSYAKALYKYPQAAFPYGRLVSENAARGRHRPEFEVLDTGTFRGYFDVFAEYAKASPDDLLIRISVVNRGPEPAPLHVLPTLWFRNTWSWGRRGERYPERGRIEAAGDDGLVADHPALGRYRLSTGPVPLLFTENETHLERLFGVPNATPYVKDAFHEAVVRGRRDAVNPARRGTKAAAHYRLEIPAGGEAVLRLRLTAKGEVGPDPLGPAFDEIVATRRAEADAFYAARMPSGLSSAETLVLRQAYAGLLWTKQHYEYDVREWLEGDPAYPPPPADRRRGRNADWGHVRCRDILSMPDKWEYPWFAVWDSAFHAACFAKVDPDFAREQLLVFLREEYLHPSGQMPAYEFAFDDANPPVHAWACWMVHRLAPGDRAFLRQAFHKLLLNFTWWVNRKDRSGRHLFSGGFLGLDNIGVFDRSKPLPAGGHLEQADGTAWMAFYAASMLRIALELAREDRAYEDVAWKFFTHFAAIAEAINGADGLWDGEDGFYYDRLKLGDAAHPLKVRSMVGLVALFAADVVSEETLEALPGFRRRLEAFQREREGRSDGLCLLEAPAGAHGHRLLAVPSRDRLLRSLRYVLDEAEFLSPFGVRSLSRVHRERPYVFRLGEEEHRVDYAPGESPTGMFGGNSNWRGPVWLPMNFLLVEALERYHEFYRDGLRVECPTGSGQWKTLSEAAREIAGRVERLFLPAPGGERPCHPRRPCVDPAWNNLVLFHEYFHADTGEGLGASHQTGWSALIILFVEELRRRLETAL